MSDVQTPAVEQVRKIVTELPGPKSAALAQRKQQAVSNGVATQNPIYAQYAGGGVIVDVDGNSFIDLGSGIAVTTVGASNARVVEAVRDQVSHFTHTCFMTTPYEGYVEVCELLNRITPGSFEKRSALFNSGAECVENAVKAARAYTKRPAVVAFKGAYHGRTNFTLAMTEKSHPYKAQYGPFASDVYRVSQSYPHRDGLSGEEAFQRTVSEIEVQVGSENVAALVIEPIQGEGGFIVPAEGYLPRLVQWCHEKGIVFVADEVQSGYGRTGKMFASEWEGIEPDIICTAKGIAGGLPLSAVTGRAEIMDASVPGGLGGTYGGNPLSCAAALAVGTAFEEDNLLEKALELGQHIQDRFVALQASDARIADVRGCGAMQAIELVDAQGVPDAAFTKEIQRKAYEQGVILLTCGTFGNVIRFLPPLSMPVALLDEALGVIETIMKEA